MANLSSSLAHNGAELGVVPELKNKSNMISDTEKELIQWLDMRFRLTPDDAYIIGTFISVIQKEQKQALCQAHVMPSLRDFKERRLKTGLSLREVAKATGVSAATISRAEHGKEMELGNALKLDGFYARNGA